MAKGLSPIVAAVILIAATMSIAGILTFWTTTFVSRKLNESSSVNDETSCLGAEFKLHSASYNNGILFLRLDNRRTIDLKLEKLYLFYPDNSMETYPLNSFLLKGNEIKELPTLSVRDGFTKGRINTNCPEVFLEFTYSNGVIG
jgi:flagellin-like protein